MTLFKNLTAALLVTAVAAPVMAMEGFEKGYRKGLRASLTAAPVSVDDAGVHAATLGINFDDNKLTLGGAGFKAAIAKVSGGGEAADAKIDHHILLDIYKAIFAASGNKDKTSLMTKLASARDVTLDGVNWQALIGNHGKEAYPALISQVVAKAAAAGLVDELKPDYTLPAGWEDLGRSRLNLTGRVQAKAAGGEFEAFDARALGGTFRPTKDLAGVRIKAKKGDRFYSSDEYTAKLRARADALGRGGVTIAPEALLEPTNSGAKKASGRFMKLEKSASDLATERDTATAEVVRLKADLAGAVKEADVLAKLKPKGYRSKLDAATIARWMQSDNDLVGVVALLEGAKSQIATLEAEVARLTAELGKKPTTEGQTGAGGKGSTSGIPGMGNLSLHDSPLDDVENEFDGGGESPVAQADDGEWVSHLGMTKGAARSAGLL